jgi:hypothetical protein
MNRFKAHFFHASYIRSSSWNAARVRIVSTETVLNATAMRKRFVDRQRSLMKHYFLANPSYFICGFLMVQTSS